MLSTKGGGADYECGRDEVGFAARGQVSGDQAESQLRGVPADCGAILVNGSQGHAKEIRIKNVAATDDGDVLGDAQAGVEDGAHGAERDGIVEAEDAVRNPLETEQFVRGSVAAGLAAVVSQLPIETT